MLGQPASITAIGVRTFEVAIPRDKNLKLPITQLGVSENCSSAV